MDQAVYTTMAKEHNYDFDNQFRLVTLFSFDDVTMDKVAIKCRGNTTSNNDNGGDGTNKKSYVIAFDCTDPLNTADPASANKRAFLSGNDDRKFYGEKEINLRTSPNDPSLIREMLSYKIYRENGVPAPRVSTVSVYLNQIFLGVYLLVEEVDKRLLKKHFENNDGNLYKCGYSGSGGATFNAYTYDAGRYSLATNKKTGDVSDIQTLLSSLSAVDSKDSLAQYFDVTNVLNYIAVSSITGHWDSLSGNYNNDYVYHNPADNKWYVVAWDTDNSFGSDWIGNTLNLPYYLTNSRSSQSALFCKKAVQYAEPELKAIFKELLTKYMNKNVLENEADRIRDLIKDEVFKDPFLLDYQSFYESYDKLPAKDAFKNQKMEQYRSGLGVKEYFKERLEVINNEINP
ncbi:MAG: hypothetical protein A2355_00605 [Spirochaetes bacterium RIFOXYB1_FULL_32_8]|nr:MAG: hypothetical protein A2355_00605 [Spirochaetes bacterium RIFOXYB1_FULL_32_8]